MKENVTQLPWRDGNLHYLALSGFSVLDEERKLDMLKNSFVTQISAMLGERPNIFILQSCEKRRKRRHLPLDGQPRSCSLSPWVKTNRQQSPWWQQHLIWTTSLCTRLFTTASHSILITHQTVRCVEQPFNCVLTPFRKAHSLTLDSKGLNKVNKAVNKMC